MLATLKAQMLLKQSNTAKATQASTLSLTTTKTDNNSSATESKAVETPSQSAPLPAVAAAATTATTTPLSTTTLKSKEKTTTPSSGPLPIRGLVNCGNTCFFNSVCQSLGQTKALIQMSTRPDAFQSFLPTKAALLTTVASLRAGSGKGSSSYTPTDLLVRAGAANSRFRGRQQQDAHELLRYILDAAREEERKKLTGQLSATPVTPTFQQKPSSSKNKTSSNTVSSSSSSPVTTPIKKSSSPPPKTWIDAIFGGELESRVTCLTCKNISTTTESFLDLSISLPQSKSVNSDSSSNKLSAATEARALLRQRLRKASAMEDIERQKARQSAAAASLDSAPATLSKHQQKKAKKQSRKV